MDDFMMTARPRLVAQARLQWDPVREKEVMLFPEGVLVLNPTASAILKLCDGQNSVSEIITTLCVRYARAVDQDVLTFLNRLADKRLLEFLDE